HPRPLPEPMEQCCAAIFVVAEQYTPLFFVYSTSLAARTAVISVLHQERMNCLTSHIAGPKVDKLGGDPFACLAIDGRSTSLVKLASLKRARSDNFCARWHCHVSELIKYCALQPPHEEVLALLQLCVVYSDASVRLESPEVMPTTVLSANGNG